MPVDPRGPSGSKTPPRFVPYAEMSAAAFAEQRARVQATQAAEAARATQAAREAVLRAGTQDAAYLPAPPRPKPIGKRFAELSRDTPVAQGSKVASAGLWQTNGVDFTSPSGMCNPGSSYRRFLKETADGRYSTPNGRVPVPSNVYVPPWRLTMTELYGKELVERMKQEGRESYVERANRYADEEAARRRGLMA